MTSFHVTGGNSSGCGEVFSGGRRGPGKLPGGGGSRGGCIWSVSSRVGEVQMDKWEEDESISSGVQEKRAISWFEGGTQR